MKREDFIRNGYLPPWGIEFNKNMFVLLDFIVEVIISENENTTFGFNTGYKVESRYCNQ